MPSTHLVYGENNNYGVIPMNAEEPLDSKSTEITPPPPPVMTDESTTAPPTLPESPTNASRPPIHWGSRILRFLLVLMLAIVIAAMVVEMQTSWLQSWLFSRYAKCLTW